MPLNCKACGAPLKGDEEHCPYCGSFINFEDRPGYNADANKNGTNKNLPQVKYASEIFIVIISVFTLGLYGIYWYANRRGSFNNLVKGLKFPDIALGIYIVGWIMLFMASSGGDPELAEAAEESNDIVGIAYLIIWAGALWMSFGIKKILHEYISLKCKDEAAVKLLKFSDVMLFCFGYIYLQVQINKMINAEILAPKL